MFVEIGLQGKGFITSFAIKVLESRMGLHVSTKIGPDQERLQIKDEQGKTKPLPTCQQRISHSEHSRRVYLRCEISYGPVVTRDD